MIDTILLAVVSLLLTIIGFGLRAFYTQVVKYKDEITAWREGMTTLVNDIDKRLYRVELKDGIADREEEIE